MKKQYNTNVLLLDRSKHVRITQTTLISTKPIGNVLLKNFTTPFEIENLIYATHESGTFEDFICNNIKHRYKSLNDYVKDIEVGIVNADEHFMFDKLSGALYKCDENSLVNWTLYKKTKEKSCVEMFNDWCKDIETVNEKPFSHRTFFENLSKELENEIENEESKKLEMFIDDMSYLQKLNATQAHLLEHSYLEDCYDDVDANLYYSEMDDNFNDAFNFAKELICEKNKISLDAMDWFIYENDYGKNKLDLSFNQICSVEDFYNFENNLRK